MNAINARNSRPVFSKKGQKLLDMYASMAADGYATQSGDYVESAFNDFELIKFKHAVLADFRHFGIKSVLDYGCGGSNWEAAGFDGTQSAKSFFGLDEVCLYEPARGMDERKSVDAVVCFDVLEHIFVSDVPAVLRDMMSCAKKLLVINVACYKANALLPNGENAHITARHPIWWKGVLDCLCPEFPDLSINLISSEAYNKASRFPIFSDNQRQADTLFDIGY